MRISDWSSDVCSSDLRVHHRPEREMGFRLDQVVRVEIALADVISADGEPIRIKGSQLAGAVARHPMHHLGGFFAKPRPFLAGDFLNTDAGTEIGRASCRARVCQYA